MNGFALLLPATLIVLAVLWRAVLWHPRPLRARGNNVKPLLLGHRGVRIASGPGENTIAAFRLALESGLDGIECDVQQTRDGRLVLHHDPQLAGLRVTETDLAELRAMAPDLATLDELFDLARAFPHAVLNLELKLYRSSGKGMEARLATSVLRARLADRVLVSSFNPLALARLRLCAPALRTGLLTDPRLPLPLRNGWLAGWLHTDALHPQWEQVDEAMRARARERGLALYVWTVNDATLGRRLLAGGVNGLIGDYPERLREAAGGPAGG